VHNGPLPTLRTHCWSYHWFLWCDSGLYGSKPWRLHWLDLSIRIHVWWTASRCSATLRQLRTRRQVPTTVLQSLVTTLVLPHIDYCNSVLYGLPTTLIRHLQSVQNATVWLIFGLQHSEHKSTLEHKRLMGTSSVISMSVLPVVLTFLRSVKCLWQVLHVRYGPGLSFNNASGSCNLREIQLFITRVARSLDQKNRTKFLRTNKFNVVLFI